MLNLVLRRVFILLGVVMLSGAASAFHDGGVASCATCHVLHTLADGFPIQPSLDNNYLLRFNAASDLCLSCHAADHGAVWANNAHVPAPERGGGNFVFGAAANLNDAPDGNLLPLSGSHGIHNCIAPTQNSTADPNHVTAPGGTYPSSALGCTSCHDPHGNQNFRMLWGAGQIQGGQFTFVHPAPEAAGIALNGSAESPTLHTAYRSGWTNWCANCHGQYHGPALAGFRHPVHRALGSDVSNSYRYYDGASNPQGGDPSSAYLPEVPFEDANMTTTSTDGPSPNSRISCITCHRAHGSSAVDLGRWDFRVLNITQDGFPSGSYPLPSPYSGGSPERQLCVKCHEQATRTHGFDRACIECHRFATIDPWEFKKSPPPKLK